MYGAIQTAKSAPESTVFITDSGDNTAAGAVGDGTLVLQKLIVMGVKDVVFAGIYNPQDVKDREEAGEVDIVHLKVGGKLDTVFSKQLEIIGLVRFTTRELNKSNPGRRPVVVQIDSISQVLLNQRRSFISLEDFKEAGIDPLAQKIVIVKLGYLFQGLKDIAPRTIMALTPGFTNQVIVNLPYRSVRRPTYLLDPDMAREPSF